MSDSQELIEHARRAEACGEELARIEQGAFLGEALSHHTGVVVGGPWKSGEPVIANIPRTSSKVVGCVGKQQ